jgi:4-hydroxythreonine-4-phosphate dehydrogenase
MKRPVRIGITLGDVNGIGPEVALKAAAAAPANIAVTLIGSAPVVREQAAAFSLPQPPVWDPSPQFRPKWTPGRIRRDASEAAAAWIRAAVGACRSKRFDAMVTAPICKEGFHKAGIRVPGHTELLAELTGTRRFAMMLFGGDLRILLATRHLPLKDVARSLTRGTVLEAIRITGEALPWLGCRRGRIAVCGLNPHAGDGGEIGKEELTVIGPAIRQARKEGFDAVGPVPADVVFHHALQRHYDAVVAMYHDQGLGPLKMLAFDVGVNVTLGLPLVRTSPDHGTAFDIAGRNKANPSSMIEAIRWAAKLAGRRSPWQKRME